jgi:hypothetical protein
VSLVLPIEVEVQGREDVLSLASAVDELAKQTRSGLSIDIDAGAADVLGQLTADAARLGKEFSAVDEAARFDVAKSELQGLLAVQEKALAAMKATGRDGSAEYATLKLAVAKTREEVELLADAEASVGSGDPDGGLKALLTGSLIGDGLERAGGFLQGIADGAKQSNDALRIMAAQTGATGAEFERLKASAGNLFAAGVGDSFDEAVKAISAADAQLGQFFNPAELEAFTQTAGGIAKTYDKDITEVIGKSRTLIANFGLTGEQASNLVAGVAQGAANGMDDVFDTLDEYSQLASQVFGEGGEGAAKFTALLTKGIQAGARDTDKLADLAKESQIKILDGSALEGLAAIQTPINATIEGIVKAGQQGKISVSDVLSQAGQAIETAFNAGEISESMRSQLQVAISGTPAEDLGADLYGRIFGTPIDTSQVEAQGNAAREALEATLGPTDFVSSALREVEALGAGLAGTFQPAIAGAASFLSATSAIAPALTLMQSNFGGLAKSGLEFAKGILSKIVPGLFAQAGATGAVTAATTAQGVATVGATGALRAMFVTMLTNPIFLVIAGITALGVALYAILSAGESVEEAMEGVATEMERSQKVFEQTTELDKQADNLIKLADSYDALKGKTDPESQAEFTAAANEMGAAMPFAVEGLGAYADAHDKAGQALSISTDTVRAFAEEDKRLNAQIRAGAVSQLLDEMEDLGEATSEAFEDTRDLEGELAAAKDTLERWRKADDMGKMSGLTKNAKEHVEDLQAELGAAADEAKRGNVEFGKGVLQARKMGASWETIAEDTGKSVTEIQLYAKQAEAAARAAREVERGAEGMTVQTIEAQDHTRGLAEQWDNTANSVHGAVDEMLKAVAFLILQSRQQMEAAASGGSLAELLLGTASNAIIQTKIREDLRQQIKLMKEVDGILEELKIEFGLVARSSKSTTTTAGQMTEVLVELSEAYVSSLRETKKVRAEITEGEKEAVADVFGTIAASFTEAGRVISDTFNDERKKITDEVAAAQKEYEEALKDGGGDTFEIKIEVEADVDGDGTIEKILLSGQAAVDALLKQLGEQEKAEREKIIADIVKREREATKTIYGERITAADAAFTEEQAIERERLDFLNSFGDETTEKGLLDLQTTRLALLEEEKEEKLRAFASETAAFKTGQAAIVATLQDRINATQAALRAGTITEAQAAADREKAILEATEQTEKLRGEVVVESVKDTNSLAYALVRKNGQQQEQVIEDIGAKIRALKSDWDFVTDAVTGATSIMLDAFHKFYDELDAMREEDAAKAAGTRDKDFADLKKDLLDMRITYEEFSKSVAALRAEGVDGAEDATEAEKTALQTLGAVLRSASKEQTRTRADAIDTQKLLTTEYVDEVTKEGETITAKTKEQEAAWDVLAQATSVAVGGMVTSIAGLAAEGELSMESFGIAMIDTIAATLDSVIPALVALIFGKAFAANPLTGGIVASVAIAGLLGLAALAKSALSKGLDSKMTGGYAGDGSMTEEKGIYHAGEFITTKRHTKKYRKLLDTIQADKDPTTWFINEVGKMTKEARVDMFAPLMFDGLDPIAWILKENGVRDRMEIAREIVGTLPGYRLTSDRTVPQMLTNADGSVRGTREIVGAIDRQTTALDSRLGKVEGEMKKVQATFSHQSAVKLTGESSISGNDIRIVYEKQRAADLSS